MHDCQSSRYNNYCYNNKLELINLKTRVTTNQLSKIIKKSSIIQKKIIKPQKEEKNKEEI